MATIYYPIGIQTFSEIRQENYIYVDKTEYIWELINKKKKYVFLSRPRRFGKSLLVSTFDAYFRGRHDLFKGLAIDGLEKEWTEYPVLHMSFGGQDYAEQGNLEGKLELFLRKFEKEYGVKAIGKSPAILRKNAYPLEDLEGSRRNEDQLSDMADPNRDIVPMLFKAGYLTIKGWLPESEEYVLGFPNREVRLGFWDSLSQYYVKQKPGNTIFNINFFVEDVEKGNAEGFMVRLRSLFASIESEHEPNKEVHFRNMMVIVSKMCGFRTHSEIHTSEGRCDMTIETDRYCYVFEFKINSSAEEALRQIKEKGYAIRYEADGRKVFLIGANFSTKSRTLTDWIIE